MAGLHARSMSRFGIDACLYERVPRQFFPVDDGDPIRWEECKRDGENMLTDLERLDEILNFSSHRSLVCQVKKKRTRKGVTNQEPSLGCV